MPVDLRAPAMIGADEIATYIADLPHEAVPTQGDDRVLRLPDAVDSRDAHDAHHAPDATRGR